MRIGRLFPATIVLAFVSSCLIVPVPIDPGDPHPYRQSVVEEIEIGESTNADVVAEFGTPYRTFGDERWSVYRASATTTKWYVIGATMVGGDTWVEGGRELAHYLIMEFDDTNVVRRMDVVTSKRPCNREENLCFRGDSLEVSDSKGVKKKYVYYDDLMWALRNQQ